MKDQIETGSWVGLYACSRQLTSPLWTEQFYLILKYRNSPPVSKYERHFTQPSTLPTVPACTNPPGQFDPKTMEMRPSDPVPLSMTMGMCKPGTYMKPPSEPPKRHQGDNVNEHLQQGEYYCSGERFQMTLRPADPASYTTKYFYSGYDLSECEGKRGRHKGCDDADSGGVGGDTAFCSSGWPSGLKSTLRLDLATAVMVI